MRLEAPAPGSAVSAVRRLASSEGKCIESSEANRADVQNQKTVLICDDEPMLRELVRASLEFGYRFAEANDGIVALELARELRPDVVILDLMLPRRGGLEVLADIRTDERLRTTPVLVVSAWPERREAALEAGADDFVTKPFDPDELKRSMEELLGME
ncbi:MAG: response regulator [Actinobacteria bacterium]|nr:MAG: response regulator [Actinomycetota bacterium]